MYGMLSLNKFKQRMVFRFLRCTLFYAISPPVKAPHWYAVQVSDTTMLTIAASLPGQPILDLFRYQALPLILSNQPCLLAILRRW